ncbi:hypothetical protein EPO05_01495 [Patescibacteria group bacterium]|nr:MAG: hypothetical protein EPO05_01495 [Patescibacteria group bacterium]
MNRSGQFMTFFIKNQMIGLAPADIQDAERNPQGKFKLHEDAALALNRPLHEVYGTFLERIVAKYQNDPWQMQRYLAFLRQPISVPRYEEKNGEIVRTDEVFCTIVEQNQANATEGTIDIGRAKLNFLMNLEVVCRQLGIARPRAATFLDIFNKFKEIDWKAQRSWSIPLKHTMVERMRMIRKTLEPIFSMLCVLDDSFDVEMPPEQSGEEGPGENGGEGGPEGEPKWKPGDKVRDARNGRKGVITAVTLGPDGKPTSVTVDYVEDEAQVQQMAGASGALIPRETVEIPDPDENLILIVRPGQGGSTTSSKSDPRKKEFDGEEPKDKDKNGEPKEGEGDDKPDDKPSDDKKNKKPSRGKGKADKPKPAKDQDLGKVMSGYEKWLREALNQDGRNENLGKLEAAKQSPEHRERAVERERMEEAIRRLRELRRQAKEPVPEENDLRDRAVVEQYFQLEAKLRPFFEKMAEHWTEVVQNIASKIEVKREKYFRSGKVDVERIQRYLPEIEFGADIDDRMIYEQFVEKIISELRPKLLRVILLVDNSGSMAGEKANAVRATVMLLNASLRSLRVLFRNKMRAVLGEDAQRVDLACDVEVRLFGAQHERIQKFAIKDLKFVRDDNSPFPALDPDQEMLATLRVFQKFAADGSHTDDSDAWDEILLDHRNDKVVQELLAGQNMTEVLFQISDGNMNPAATVQPHIEELREMGVSIAGLAIGGGDAERNLLERLGQGNVALSDRPEQLVERFGELLKRIVGERVAKVMEDILQTEQ